MRLAKTQDLGGCLPHPGDDDDQSDYNDDADQGDDDDDAENNDEKDDDRHYHSRYDGKTKKIIVITVATTIAT